MMRLVLVVLVWRLVKARGAGMVERPPVVVRIICVVRLVLLARMRVLWGVIDIVVRSYSVVARQRASDTWVPPERTALAGRRALNGENLRGGSPAGLRRERLRGNDEVAGVQDASQLSSEDYLKMMRLSEEEPRTCVVGRRKESVEVPCGE